MANAPDKRAQREAAERVEQGIERYASGDVAASAREFEEALKLLPGHPRATACLEWVKDLQSGKRALPSADKLDADLLEAVSDALSDAAAPSPVRSAESGPILTGEEEQTREKRHLALAEDDRQERDDGPAESPWDPVPLTPSTVEKPGMSASGPPPAAPRQPSSSPKVPPVAPPSSTLLGVAPPSFDRPMLTPSGAKHARPLYSTDENTGSHTREWRGGTPTGTNLPPLDVPELTDQQIQELLALDGNPQLDVPEVAPTLELEAEPTPVPHRNPLQRKKDDTTPDAQLSDANFMSAPLRYESGEFDAFEQTPTRDRGSLLQAVAGIRPQTTSEDELQLPPLESPRGREESQEEGTNPTNPFINRKMAEYASYSPPPRDEELPPPPGQGSGDRTRDTNETTALNPIEGLGEAIERADIPVIMELAEAFVAEAGGVDTETAKPQAWLLERAYEAVVGPLDKVPAHGEATPTLDPHSAFLLSRLDGMTCIDDLLDVSGMPRLHALRLLALLIRRGVVTLK